MSHSEPPHPKKHPEKSPGPEKHPEHERPSSVGPTPPASARNPKHNGGDETPPWKKRADIIAVVVAIGLLLVNIVQSCASKKAADAAVDAVKGAQEQMRLDQRAWVSIVQGQNIVDQPAAPQSMRIGTFVIDFQNSGKTPGRDLTNYCCIFLTRMPQDPVPDYDRDFASNASVQEMRRGVVGPAITNRMEVQFGQDYQVEGGVYVVNGKVAATNPPRRYVYVIGKFTYRDIFEGSKPHTTKFCFVNTKGNEFRLCTSGQWMD